MFVAQPLASAGSAKYRIKIKSLHSSHFIHTHSLTKTKYLKRNSAYSFYFWRGLPPECGHQERRWGPVQPGRPPRTLLSPHEGSKKSGSHLFGKITNVTFQLYISALKMSLMQKDSCYVCGKGLGRTTCWSRFI